MLVVTKLLLMGEIFLDNLADFFLEDGQYIARSKDSEEIERLDKPTYNQVYADITTTFTILIGIFFPSVTGKQISTTVLLRILLVKEFLVQTDVFCLRRYHGRFKQVR